MTSTVQQRLEAWRALVRGGGPAWLVEAAPRIIVQLEAELAAQGIEAPSGGETAKTGSTVGESPVSEADAPEHSHSIRSPLPEGM